MNIKFAKTRSRNCTICAGDDGVCINCEANSGTIIVRPRYRKQVYDIIESIRNNCCASYNNCKRVNSFGRIIYKLDGLYKINYPNNKLHFYSNLILEEDFDDIIELLQGVEINNKVRLNQKDLCDYNLLQLKTILTSMKRRKKVNGEKDNYFINLEV